METIMTCGIEGAEVFHNFAPNQLLQTWEAEKLVEEGEDPYIQTTASYVAKRILDDDQWHSTAPNPGRIDAKQKLTNEQARRFQKLEQDVEKCEKASIAMALALLEISISRLYWYEYGSLKIYWKDRLEICRSRGHQLLRAAVVYRGIEQRIKSPKPWRITHLLALQHLRIDEAVIAYDYSYNEYGRRITAELIKKTIKQLNLQVYKKAREKKKKSQEEDKPWLSGYAIEAIEHIEATRKLIKTMVRSGENAESVSLFKDELERIRTDLMCVTAEIDEVMGSEKPKETV